MRKFLFTAIAVVATITCVTRYLTKDEQVSKANALALANIEALTRTEPSLNYYIEEWETWYPDRYENGRWIWVVEGGVICHEDAGDEPNCLASYYWYETIM